MRKPGAGRPAAEDSDPKLLEVLRKLVEDDTRGDRERVLCGRPRVRAGSPTS